MKTINLFASLVMLLCYITTTLALLFTVTTASAEIVTYNMTTNQLGGNFFYDGIENGDVLTIELQYDTLAPSCPDDFNIPPPFQCFLGGSFSVRAVGYNEDEDKFDSTLVYDSVGSGVIFLDLDVGLLTFSSFGAPNNAINLPQVSPTSGVPQNLDIVDFVNPILLLDDFFNYEINSITPGPVYDWIGATNLPGGQPLTGTSLFHDPSSWAWGEVPTFNDDVTFSFFPRVFSSSSPDVITFNQDAVVKSINLEGYRELEFRLFGRSLNINDKFVVGDASVDREYQKVTLKNGILFGATVAVGEAGWGELVLAEGATTSSRLTIGDKASGDGRLVLTDPGTEWNLSFLGTALEIGNEGTGRLLIQNGAKFTVQDSLDADIVLGKEVNSSGTIDVTGVGSKLAVQGDITVGLKGEGRLNVTDGGLVKGSGFAGDPVNLSIGGPIPGAATGQGGEVLIDGNGSKIIAHTLVVGSSADGNLTIQDSGRLEVAIGGSVVIGNGGGQGTVTVKDSGELISLGDFEFVVGNQGYGELRIETGGFVSNQGTANVGKFLAAAGSKVVVDGLGSMWRSGTYSPLGLAGEISLDNSSDLIVSDGGNVETSLLRAQDFSSVHLDNGHLEIDELQLLVGATLSGNGTIAGNVVSNGIIAPGNSPGTLSIAQDFTQTSDGRLEIELAGYTPGTEFDVLEIDGIATLAGTLEISLLSGFVPDPSHVFNIITASSIVGTFDQITFNGGTVDVTYPVSGIQLTNFQVAAIPEPSTLLLGAMASLGLLAPRPSPLAKEVITPPSLRPSASLRSLRSIFFETQRRRGRGRK